MPPVKAVAEAEWAMMEGVVWKAVGRGSDRGGVTDADGQADKGRRHGSCRHTCGTGRVRSSGYT